MAYFLALDAGGTRTECWLADGERVLARETGGTVKLMNVGEEEATARLLDLLTRTAAKASVSLHSVNRTCVGLAGISSSGVRAWAETLLAASVGGEVLLVGDEEIALHAAFGNGPGILVISGTGSHVVGRCSDGTRMTAGGWGPMLGDEGSGYWIGLEAIRSGLRARDRGVPTCILRDIVHFWEVDGTGGLIAKANMRPRPDFAALAIVVAQCAEQGDAIARSVLERAGAELAAQIDVVISNMRASGCAEEDATRVAFTGSILENVTPVLQELRSSLHRSHPHTVVQGQPVQPILGALARARGA